MSTGSIFQLKFDVHVYNKLTSILTKFTMHTHLIGLRFETQKLETKPVTESLMLSLIHI